jgi:hypothetical protein
MGRGLESSQSGRVKTIRAGICLAINPRARLREKTLGPFRLQAGAGQNDGGVSSHIANYRPRQRCHSKRRAPAASTPKKPIRSAREPQCARLACSATWQRLVSGSGERAPRC